MRCREFLFKTDLFSLFYVFVELAAGIYAAPDT